MDIGIVDVRGVSKSTRGRVRLADVSMTLMPGRVYGLVGPNGAGKSTLLSILAGLTLPDRGAVDLRHSVDAPLRVGASLGTDDLHPARSVIETMRLSAMLRGVQRTSVDGLITQCGLGPVQRRRVRALSLGMRARLGIAMAMLGDPEVVLLDEPMNGLDPDGMSWVRQITADLRARGRIVVVSSHLLREIDAVADEVFILSQGRMVSSVGRSDEELGAGSEIVVSEAQVLVDRLEELGHEVSILGGRIQTVLSAADLVRVSVELGLDVNEVGPRRRPALERIFDSVTVAEFSSKAG
ncbi:ABC transporter ATP-binding protein [Curtobacterium sp. Leaf261]|uniref:ABC transporter ATP-binding protein n=1 Tax=Curtobacterium sp. Leaf261 TaxID=1736311 RepID=UPI0006F6EC17|nr:ATP-binding cassette domain-containing protein [Curtobacterium sp. Leaf261]KQO63596.1 hypothetical protein ASF23_05020 [Curtobacterium sp. Leaf261]